MKKIGMLMSLLAVSLAAGVAWQHAHAMDAKHASMRKSWYVIESKHTGPECLAALDSMNEKKLLGKTYWGCKAGDHRGWTILQADSNEDALNLLPANQRADAQIVQVTKFSPEELKQIHANK